jgi:hypothetical protein
VVADKGHLNSAQPRPKTVTTGNRWIEIGSGEFSPPGNNPVNGLPDHHRSGRAEQVAWAHDNDQNRDVLWVGTSRGGLWKPIVDKDGRTKYLPLTDNFPGSHTLGSFLIHPTDSRKILIGTGSFWDKGSGITDEGTRFLDENFRSVMSGNTARNPASES